MFRALSASSSILYLINFASSPFGSINSQTLIGLPLTLVSNNVAMTRRFSNVTRLPERFLTATSRRHGDFPWCSFTSRYASTVIFRQPPVSDRTRLRFSTRRDFRPNRKFFSSASPARDLPEQDGLRAETAKPGKGLSSKGVSLLCVWLAANIVIYATSIDDSLARLAVGNPLNSTSFEPFTVVAREQVSPTSFILTVRPRFAREPEQADAILVFLRTLFPFCRFPREVHTNRPVLEQAWRHGLWSVETKQPQLQVARHYTPLPAESKKAEVLDLERGEMRFFIRKIDAGEVSSYLSLLGVGDQVELRGPHLGFDVRARLGSAGRVVFLAGGTGVAPALQTMRALLDSPHADRPSVSLIWANRHRADCPGAGNSSSPSSPNAMVSLLDHFKQRHPNALHYSCTVEEEGAVISAADILQATGFHARCRPTKTASRWFSSRSTALDDENCPDPSPVNTTACAYHSAAALASSAGKDPSSSPDGSSWRLLEETVAISRCGCVDVQGMPTLGGKNLLMVSGPEGFIAAYAGSKVWGNGKELQGQVGGAVGAWEMILPKFWADWLVLKL